LRERILLWLITCGALLLIRLIGPTLRIQITREEGCLADGYGPAPPGIYCFWHRCIIPAAYHFRNMQVAIMISQSFDGEYIARIAQKLGFRPVRGSSSRGGAGAFLAMRQELEQGYPAVFTADGPRGPMYVLKPGPVLLAQKTGYKITGFHLAVERAWVLKSWDRMMIPKPFSRVAIYGSSPLEVPPDASGEQMQSFHQQLQEIMDRCVAGAEAKLKQ
jgi:lysophospholipid acyltransferase (LPLAT)-like uncharacterized protein